MRRLICTLRKILLKRYSVCIFAFIFIILIIDSYVPTISYLIFKYSNRNLTAWEGLSIRMGDGWYPIECCNSQSNRHITLVKK